MFAERRSRSFEIAVAISAVLHITMVLIASRSRPPSGDFADMQEVSFMDVTYRPEVARILPKASIPGGGGAVDDAPVPTYSSGIASDEVPAIDLSASLERDKSQAKIDMDGLELDRGDGMSTIKLGGSGSAKSTDEILAQPKVALARGLSTGGKGIPGLRGMPGVPQQQAQLSIERRSLAKPVSRALPTAPTAQLPAVAAAPTKGSQFMIAGPISEREIKCRVVPRYPKWALERRISGTVVVKLWVLPDGRVKGVPQVENSSGYPDLDQVVVDALRGWEFAALAPGVKSEDQWGVITFRFTLS
ncbi:MAG: energy transducer TonB [bacterium]